MLQEFLIACLFNKEISEDKKKRLLMSLKILINPIRFNPQGQIEYREKLITTIKNMQSKSLMQHGELMGCMYLFKAMLKPKKLLYESEI